MKKHLLLAVAIGIGNMVFAQHTVPATLHNAPKLKPEIANKAVPVNKYKIETYAPNFQAAVNASNASHPTSIVNTSKSFTSNVIGTSMYDLQTNASVCNRIVVCEDSTISATWTMSHDTDPTSSPNRGTGYNYFNDTVWGTPPTARIESIRCGWPNIGLTKTHGEVIVSHEATGGAGNIHVLTRPVKGTGAWHDTTLNYPDVWSRMVVAGSNGNTIHIISQTTGASASPNPPFHGQDGAIAYSRSTDGGLTWDKYHTVIPEIDSSFYRGFGGDSYAIDGRGDTIAIVAGGFDVDVVLLKSTDNGSTWTKTIVKQFPIPMYNAATMNTDLGNDGITDTIETNDAAVAVLLDKQGKAHVWYGRMRVTEDPGGTTLSYFPGTDGLAYWNESMTEPGYMAFALDINGNGTLDVTKFGTYQIGFSSTPSAGIDDAGNIYVSYSSIFEGISDDGTVGGGKSFRHTYVKKSSDGGVTWCGPIDVVDPDVNSGTYDYLEGVFGATARKVNNSMHLIYQRDSAPGDALTTNNPDPQSGNESEIVYANIPVNNFDAFTTCDSLVYNIVSTLGIKENTETVSNISIFPNPATNVVNMVFTLNQPEKITIELFNVVGQKLTSTTENFTSGNNSFTLNLSNYKPGLYYVKSSYKNKVITKKLIKE